MNRYLGPSNVDDAIVALERELGILDDMVAVLLGEDEEERARLRMELLLLGLQSPNPHIREAAMYLLAEEDVG